MPERSAPLPDSRKIVILMGATGSGKSTFISNILGSDVGIGHDLKSCTKQIEEHEVEYHEAIILVDTPGFDDSDVPDVVILKRISDWLKKQEVKESAIAGVIYLNNISDARMSGSAQRNLKTFEGLCGKDYAPKIIIVTTRWSDEGTTRYRHEEAREKIFKNEYWRNLLENGAQTARLVCRDTNQPFPGNMIDPDHAWVILEDVLKLEGESSRILMSVEVVDQKKKVNQTTAGKVVEASLDERIAALDKKKKELKVVKGKGDAELLQGIKDEVRLMKYSRAQLQGSLWGMLRWR